MISLIVLLYELFNLILLHCRKYVCLLHDEMKIQADLVFDPVSGELVGFLNQIPSGHVPKGDEELAAYVLVFYVVGLNNSINVFFLRRVPHRQISTQNCGKQLASWNSNVV